MPFGEIFSKNLTSPALFQLLEERDTLQLKLSNVMRQYERQKESSSRASTAASTPIPWFDNTSEIKELRSK